MGFLDVIGNVLQSLGAAAPTGTGSAYGGVAQIGQGLQGIAATQPSPALVQLQRLAVAAPTIYGPAAAQAAAAEADPVRQQQLIAEKNENALAPLKALQAQQQLSGSGLDLKQKQFGLLGSYLSGASDQPSWDAAKQQIAKNLGPDAASVIPDQYDPAFQQRVRFAGASPESQIALYDQKQKNDEADERLAYAYIASGNPVPPEVKARIAARSGGVPASLPSPAATAAAVSPQTTGDMVAADVAGGSPVAANGTPAPLALPGANVGDPTKPIPGLGGTTGNDVLAASSAASTAPMTKLQMAQAALQERIRHNQATETMSAGPFAGASQGVESNPQNLPPDQFLKTLPPDAAALAQAAAAGEAPISANSTRNNPSAAKIFTAAKVLNPNITTTSAKMLSEYRDPDSKAGFQVQTFNKVADHMQTLGQLAGALNNGDVQLFNQIGNSFAAQTGNAAPTNFESAKQIVSGEIAKAIAGSVVAEGDRERANDVLSKANSPAQLVGAISTIQGLMGKQMMATGKQYAIGTAQALGTKNGFQSNLEPAALNLFQGVSAEPPKNAQGASPASVVSYKDYFK